jgi:chromosome segregation ATPase
VKRQRRYTQLAVGPCLRGRAAPIAGRESSASQGQTELQVDPEQVEAFTKCIDLLLAGGYFRARIQNLEPFDKIAGGIAWCLINIQSEDQEFHLLLQEHSRMGDKIYLSENIERALASLKCPHVLQAQQLYYLDCIHIFPVIQWLVKKMIEVRQQMDERLRAYSEAQFRKCAYALPDEALWETRYRDNSVQYLHDTTQRYLAAQRKYKLNLDVRRLWHQRHRQRHLASLPRESSVARTEEDEEVHAVLLQYGQGHLYTQQLHTSREIAGSARGTTVSPSQQQQQSAPIDEDVKALQARTEQLMRDMSLQKSEGWRDISLSGESLTDLQTQGAEYLRAREGDELNAESGDKLHGEAQHQRHLAQLTKQIHNQQTKLDKIKDDHERLLREVESLQQQLAAVTQQNLQYTSNIKTLLAKETPENAKELATLRSLVALNNNLTQQRKRFIATTQEQLNTWKQLLASYNPMAQNSVPGEDLSRIDEINRVYEQDISKRQQLAEHLAFKARQILLVKRKIDEVPSRRELLQYQRHFLELYEQMAVKYTETKQYFNTFNTLVDTRECLEREVSILNSIQKSYSSSMKSKNAKQQFIESLEAVVASLEKSLEAAKSKFETEKKKRDDLDVLHSQLVEKERSYYKAAKEFQEECRKAEQLQERLASLSASS